MWYNVYKKNVNTGVLSYEGRATSLALAKEILKDWYSGCITFNGERVFEKRMTLIQDEKEPKVLLCFDYIPRNKANAIIEAAIEIADISRYSVTELEERVHYGNEEAEARRNDGAAGEVPGAR